MIAATFVTVSSIISNKWFTLSHRKNFCLLLGLQVLVFASSTQGQSTTMQNVKDIIQKDASPSDPVLTTGSVQHLNWNWYTQAATVTTLAPTIITHLSIVPVSLWSTTASTEATTVATTTASFSTGRAVIVQQPSFANVLTLLNTTNGRTTTATTVKSIVSADETTSVTATSILSTSNTASSLHSTNPLDVTILSTTSTSITSSSYLGWSNTSQSSTPGSVTQYTISLRRTTGSPTAHPRTAQVILWSPGSTLPPTTAAQSTVTSTATSSSSWQSSLRRSVPGFADVSYLVSIGLSAAATDDVASARYHALLKDNLTALYHLAESRHETSLISSDHSALPSGAPISVTTRTSVAGAGRDLAIVHRIGNFTAQLAQLTWKNNSDPTQGNLTVTFSVWSPNGTIIPASQVLQRLSLLTDEDMSSALGTSLTKRPFVGPALEDAASVNISWYAVNNNSYVYGLSSGLSNNSQSWPLVGAIVGISTIAAVLLSLALVWLILFVYRKCTKKPTKTAQAPIVMTDNTKIIRIPLPPPRQPVSVDHAVQTVILPRRVLPVPSYAANTNSHVSDANDSRNRRNGPIRQDPPNPLGGLYMETAAYTKYSYTARDSRRVSPPDVQAMSLMSPPPSKPPRLINEPQRQLSAEDWRSTTPQVRSSDVVASSTSSRVKLLSVVKTNRVEAWNDKTIDGSLIELQTRLTPQDIGRAQNGARSLPSQALPDSSYLMDPLDPRYSSRGTDLGSGSQSRLAPGRGSRNQDSGDGAPLQRQAGNVPYHQTVQEIHREVRLWRRSRDSYSPHHHTNN